MSPSTPVIIVTGGSRGLGLAIVQILLANFNARVITISRSLPDGLRSLASEYDGRLTFVQGDVADDNVAKQACDTAISSYGHLDGIILNAGVADPMGPIATASIPEWQSAFSINFFSLVSMLTHATPLLRPTPGKQDGGRVVFVSSGASVGNTAGWGAYNATKAAMNSLCRTYANEEKDIASFAVRPGVVDTDMQLLIRTSGPRNMNPEELEKFTTMHQEGSLLNPMDPGYCLAALAVRGPIKLSGSYLSWNAPELAEFQRAK